MLNPEIVPHHGVQGAEPCALTECLRRFCMHAHLRQSPCASLQHELSVARRCSTAPSHVLSISTWALLPIPSHLTSLRSCSQSNVFGMSAQCCPSECYGHQAASGSKTDGVSPLSATRSIKARPTGTHQPCFHIGRQLGRQQSSDRAFNVHLWKLHRISYLQGLGSEKLS